MLKQAFQDGFAESRSTVLVFNKVVLLLREEWFTTREVPTRPFVKPQKQV